jgi:hypothetical protein
MGLYVYAVARASEEMLPELSGIFDRPVYRLDGGPLCAIVSESRECGVRGERKHFATTFRIISTLSSEFDILPVAFGTISKSNDELRRFLEGYSGCLLEQMERISGAIEMSLSLKLGAADLGACLVDQATEPQAPREAPDAGTAERRPDHESFQGRSFDEALQKYSDDYAALSRKTLAKSCIEIIDLPVRSEYEIAKLAALVPRSDVNVFEAAVRASAAEVDQDITFEIGGPWPPNNFVWFKLGDRQPVRRGLSIP